MPKRGLSTERSFVVFEVYYKHGEYIVSYYHSVEDLEDYLHARLERYCRYDGTDYEEIRKDFAEDKQQTIESFIAFAVKKGKEQLENRNGYGIVSVEELAAE